MKKSILVLFVLILFISCKKEKTILSIDIHEISMHYNETHAIVPAMSPDNSQVFSLKWSTADSTIATVNQVGIVSGVHIGETDITAQTPDGSLSQTCHVTIIPLSHLYEEPIIEFGQTMQYVKSKVKLSLAEASSTVLLYNGPDDNVRLVGYSFDYNQLVYSAVFLSNSVNIANQAGDFLLERYDLVLVDNYVYFFLVNQNTIAALNYDSTMGLNVLYFESSINKSSNGLTNKFESVISQIRQTLIKSGNFQ